MTTKPLGELCDFIRGVTFPSGEGKSRPFENSIACLTTSGVQREVAWKSRRFVQRCRVVSERQLLQRGDILISTANSKELVGKSCVVGTPPFPCTFGAFVTVARPKAEVHPRFLAFSMVTPQFLQWCFRTSANTTNISNLRVSELEAFVLPLPDWSEQERIAALLEKARRLSRTRRYARQLSDTFLQSVFLEMFGDPATNSKGYDVEPFDDSLEDIDAGVNFKPIGDNEPASPWRVLKVSAVTSGEFKPFESKPISPLVVPAKKLIVQNGDFLMSRANTVELVGAVCIVRAAPPRVLLPDKLWRVRFATEAKLVPDYALILLQSREMRRRIGSVATGTSGSMKNITQEDVASLLLPVPPFRLQQKFADIVRRFERLRAQQREAERQAEHLFQTLLHRAFNEGDL